MTPQTPMAAGEGWLAKMLMKLLLMVVWEVLPVLEVLEVLIRLLLLMLVLVLLVLEELPALMEQEAVVDITEEVGASNQEQGEEVTQLEHCLYFSRYFTLQFSGSSFYSASATLIAARTPSRSGNLHLATTPRIHFGLYVS